MDDGVVCVNLADCHKTNALYSPTEAVERITKSLPIAKSKRVPDFVVNARCDVQVQRGLLNEVLRRGKSYLAAGATTVFV